MGLAFSSLVKENDGVDMQFREQIELRLTCWI